MNAKVKAGLLGLAALAGAATLAPSRREKSPHTWISIAADSDTVHLGEDVYLSGYGSGLPRGLRFYVQHRTPQSDWQSIGKSWFGARTAHDYKVFTGPTSKVGLNLYRIKVPAGPRRAALFSEEIHIKVLA